MKPIPEEEIKLIEPCEEMAAEYIAYCEEFGAAGEALAPWVLERPAEDFAGLVRWLKDQARGVALKKGWVASSTFWLTRGDRRILGVANLRHELTDSLRKEGGHVGYSVRPSERNKGYATLMLKLVLQEARELGIPRILVTCAKDNLASARVIQKNGGVVDSESYSEQSGRVTQRYWIEL